MKCSIFVATLACVLSAALAFIDPKVEQAQSDFMSYVAENMGEIRMMRSSSSHLECYNTFIPLINSLAEEAKTNSQTCVTDADSLKEESLSALQIARAEIAAQVKTIQDNLNDCTANEDNLGYIKCLFGITDTDKQILDSIKSRTTALIATHEGTLNTIDKAEADCLRNAVDSAKSKSDAAFDDLRVCLAPSA